MKGRDTRGYPHRGYPPAVDCNWLRVDFDEGGKPENPGQGKTLEVRLRSTSETQPIYDPRSGLNPGHIGEKWKFENSIPFEIN